MHLKYLQTVLQPQVLGVCFKGFVIELSFQDRPSRITALAWSPNNLKLAASTSETTILLFNEKGERKDKFGLKPIDSKVISFYFLLIRHDIFFF